MRGNKAIPSLAIFGFVGVLFSISNAQISGPWDSPSFTRGVIGLGGLACLYFAWFWMVFGRFGIVPSQTMWKNPQTTKWSVFLFGCCMLSITKIFQISSIGNQFPAPTGLLLTFIGCLALLNATYVHLSQGVLSEEE
jgi:hypothetical protein